MKKKKPKSNFKDPIIFDLIEQVTKAVPKGKSEAYVTTYISKAMWRRWNKALGYPPNTKPTAWLGISKTHRVYGSETIVVNKPGQWAISIGKK
jgi:hypothetical protein